MPTLYIPYKNPSEIKKEDMYPFVDFEKIEFRIEPEGIRFIQFDEHPLRRIKTKEVINILITKQGKLKGRNSTKLHSYILHVYEWYQIANREKETNFPDDFIDSLIFDPLSEIE
ncbi:hypothetical protein VF14_13465 [Nostoc linckia z18]|uniref:Uncharacterized protein n=2 Tax=Nostoc linckia TaxID=92942 RepID=A0A9Q6ELA5_NOSLI|nr:hypothetical protein [Nostoc linckia]PHK42272.1 hypothetical protein VF12_03700 [Nostoc linckia z15]PHK45479.1 hypothetical protein VF13_16150 [Nostoc linckia z16]PHJ59057.1 hypothetical protein VF02_26135 [Nostoc linckia z1]PHJ61910.1 hypothetical protein VF05_27830 [Nostoc linckia z3]PHJ67827.1 hypothetical protein VF03_25580 [Nostoc linckia z2]